MQRLPLPSLRLRRRKSNETCVQTKKANSLDQSGFAFSLLTGIFLFCSAKSAIMSDIMIKRILFTILQFFLFLAVFVVNYLRPFGLDPLGSFRLVWMHRVVDNVDKYYVPDGLLLAIGILLVIVAIQAIRRKLCDTPWTMLAFVVAVAIGYRSGIVSHDLSSSLTWIHEYLAG